MTVDMIVQNVADEGNADISFTVPRDELPSTLQAVEDGDERFGRCRDFARRPSRQGLGCRAGNGQSERAWPTGCLRALADAGINIQMITTSEIKISALVAGDQALPALRVVHRAFELEKAVDPLADASPPARRPAGRPSVGNSRDVVHVLERLQGMEDLTIDDVLLDTAQGRVTIFGVPNAPGVAERVFREIAAAEIFVDMIVQSYPSDGTANLSFTVEKSKLAASVDVVGKLTRAYPSLRITHSPDVAKLSVSGIGLRSHTGVAIRMFRALAEAGINVAMINTSEVRVNVVVDGADGPAGLDCLKQAFADVI